jgi:hypothetical protein
MGQSMSDLTRARDLAGKTENRIPEPIARAVNEHVLMVAKKLGLGNWMIVVNDAPPRDEDATATMNSRVGQRFAGIWLSDKFLDPDHPALSDEIRSQCLIHEVLHLHFEDAWHLVEDVTDNELGKQAAHAVQHVFRGMMEVAIDQLAWSLVDFLPTFSLPRIDNGG